MSITWHRPSIVFMAVGALVGTIIVGQPAQGTISVVTGTVSSSNGPVATGDVSFFATCEDYDASQGTGEGRAAYDAVVGGEYSVNIPDGTYRVVIMPHHGFGAGTSWHNAKATCEQSDVITVDGYTVQNLVAQPGSDVTGTVSSSDGPVTTGRVTFYATCQVLRHPGFYPGQWLYADEAYIDGGKYTVTVPDGTYRVDIQQPNYSEHGALSSWHNAKAACEQADVVTVSGNTTQDLLALPGKQTVKTPPARLKKGKGAALAKTSSAGTRVRWKSLTNKVCTVKMAEVRSLKKGRCVLRASVPKTSAFPAYAKKFTIRVR